MSYDTLILISRTIFSRKIPTRNLLDYLQNHDILCLFLKITDMKLIEDYSNICNVCMQINNSNSYINSNLKQENMNITASKYVQIPKTNSFILESQFSLHIFCFSILSLMVYGIYVVLFHISSVIKMFILHTCRKTIHSRYNIRLCMDNRYTAFFQSSMIIV